MAGEDEEAYSSSSDRISELPWFIQHHILTFLGPKHAAETMCLSKNWLEIWSSFPFLRFNQISFRNRLLSLHRNNEDDNDNDDDNHDKETIYNGWFDQCVTKTLTTFHDNKHRIRRLWLTLDTIDVVLHLRAWIAKLNDLYIEDLMLHICVTKIKPPLPPNVFALKTITKLHLEGCDLNPLMVYPRDTIRLPSLRELSLYYVFIHDATFMTLTSSCPSIEVLCLRGCIGLQNIEIYNLNNLVELECCTYYEPEAPEHRGLEKFTIGAPKLEKLEFWNFIELEGGLPCELKVSSNVCRNLRHIFVKEVTIREEWLKNIISSLSLLEKFELENCKLPKSIKISSRSLKEVSLYQCENLEEAKLDDSPSLLSFKYYAGHIDEMNLPRFISEKPAGNWAIYIDVHHIEDVNSAWISKLFDFLATSNCFQELSIFFVFPTIRKGLNVEDLRQVQFPSHLKLEKIALEWIPSSPHLIALWDGFLWRFRPKFLSLSLTSPYFSSISAHKRPTELIKEWINHLIIREYVHCCDLEQDKCWRHFLKDVKILDGIVAVEGIEPMTSVDLKTLADALRISQHPQLDTEWCFELIW